jgi:isocitrate/isopropylmalate dehydrogenase
MHKVTLIPGDGVGPELAEATRKCVDATGVKIDWDLQECGIEVIEAEGEVPERVIDSIKSQRRRPEGPHHHADRQGLPQRERLSAAGTRAVRLRSAVQRVQGGANVLRADSPSTWC